MLLKQQTRLPLSECPPESVGSAIGVLVLHASPAPADHHHCIRRLSTAPSQSVPMAALAECTASAASPVNKHILTTCEARAA